MCYNVLSAVTSVIVSMSEWVQKALSEIFIASGHWDKWDKSAASMGGTTVRK